MSVLDGKPDSHELTRTAKDIDAVQITHFTNNNMQFEYCRIFFATSITSHYIISTNESALNEFRRVTNELKSLQMPVFEAVLSGFINTLLICK